MHKLESFALSCGSKIEKPQIQKNFYPITHKKFICISQYSQDPFNQYDYWDDVIFHIKPYLDHHGIGIIEIGPKQDNLLFYTENFSNLTRLQTNYLIDRSIMYVGNYNFYTHIASFFGKKFISPSKNDFIETNKPYWNFNNSNILIAESEEKPYFNKSEPNKSINKIMPEEIARNILSSLDIENSLDKIKTIHIGSDYTSRCVDIVPSENAPVEINYSGNIQIRLDKHFNLNFLPACNVYSSIDIITKKPIPQQFLEPIKDKINKIIYFIDDKTKLEDINSLHSIGKEILLFCDNSKVLQKTRFKFIDFNVIEYNHKSKKDLNVDKYDNLEFLSRKNIMHDNVAYNSYMSLHLKSNTAQVHNHKEMWQDLNFIRVYQKTS